MQHPVSPSAKGGRLGAAVSFARMEPPPKPTPPTSSCSPSRSSTAKNRPTLSNRNEGFAGSAPSHRTRSSVSLSMLLPSALRNRVCHPAAFPMTQPLCVFGHNRDRGQQAEEDGRTIASDTSVNRVGPQRCKNSHLARDQDCGRELAGGPASLLSKLDVAPLFAPGPFKMTWVPRCLCLAPA